MDITTEEPDCTGNNSSWGPITPGKPDLRTSKQIEHDVVEANWFGLQINSQEYQRGDEINLINERNFPEETQTQHKTVRRELANIFDIDINSISRDFDSWEESIGGSNSHVNDLQNKLISRASVNPVDIDINSISKDFDTWESTISAKSQGGTADWSNVSFENLLALAHAAVSDTVTPANYFPSSYQDLLHGSDQVSGISTHERPFMIDLNTPSKESMQSQFAPITPYKDFNVPETRNVQEISNDIMPQIEESPSQSHIVDQSSAGKSKELDENYAPDMGGDLSKTPQQKPKRKKHRPKVVIEGKPKRVYKPRTPKPPTPESTVPGKRKYVRKTVGPTPTPTKNKIDGNGTHPLEDRQTRSSCKRSLKFDDLNSAPNQVLERQACGTGPGNSTPTRGKCQILFSNSTHDKEVNFAKMMTSMSMSTSTSNSNSSSSACLTHETQVRGSKRQHSLTETNLNATGSLYNSLGSYFSIFSPNECNRNGASDMHFPQIYKKRRTEKKKKSTYKASSFNGFSFPQFDPTRYALVPYNAQQNESFDCLQALRNNQRLTKKRSKGSTRARTSLRQTFRPLFLNRIAITTKKRSKRNFSIASTLALTWRSSSPLDEIIEKFRHLNINTRRIRSMNALMSYEQDIPIPKPIPEQNALVIYKRDGTIVPFTPRKRKPRPKVDLDDETTRVWKLLLEDINSEGIDGTDEEKAKWWEEERRVFRGRSDSFIARMHLVQGDRRFSPWKGSVLDSVVGVFLTQNVSDHLSSSAFMSLASRYPLKSKTNQEKSHEEQISITTEEPEIVILDSDDAITWHEEKSNQSTSGQDSVSMNMDANSNESLGLKSNGNLVEIIQPLPCPVEDLTELDDILSSRNSSDSVNQCSHSAFEGETKTDNFSGSTSFVELLHMVGTSKFHESENGSYNMFGSSQSEPELELERDVCILEKTDWSGLQVIQNSLIAQEDQELYVPENSELSAESANQTTLDKTMTVSLNEVPKSPSLSSSTSEVLERTIITENPSDYKGKSTESSLIDAENSKSKTSKGKKGKSVKPKKIAFDWDSLRKEARANGKNTETTANTTDSLDWEAVHNADVQEIADTIKARGMNNMLAERIKALLDRLLKDHGSINMEWLRDVPPDQAKEYLLSIRGLGLKSVECVRLLTLHHLAFPVDTNVGRIAVRLGWVPLQPLPESLQLHLLELYPILESIQKYLWPRLCKLDQRTLYELHYQMITFGKVFCTKSKPNCNACPMRGECRHFASAFASARLALPAPPDKSIVMAGINQNQNQNQTAGERSFRNSNSSNLCLPQPDLNPMNIHTSSNLCLECGPSNPSVDLNYGINGSNPIITVPEITEPTVEEPRTPEPEQITQEVEPDIEDYGEDPDEIPTIKLNMEEFTQNLQMFVGKNTELQEHEMSKALVALTAEAASIPTPKLKNINRLRTEHHVYELPDSHPLLEGLDVREKDDPCPYLLAIWTPGETADSVQPPENTCILKEGGTLCDEETCFSCNSVREANNQIVRGTLLIPCRTAMRGSFPLNGTYFQVNEVFADHESSLNPIEVPRSLIWRLPRRTVYFGTSVPSIFKGLCTEEIQYCFWRGFVCVRGFEQKTRAPRPLMARLHFPASKTTRTRGGKMDGEDN